jgi:hypothetical protein
VKKLLIIQKDDAYFLFETIQVIEKNLQAFKDYDVTLLASEYSLQEVYNKSIPLLRFIRTNDSEVLKEHYIMSINLSLCEKSWKLHGSVKSEIKIGPYNFDNQILVPDFWSTYLMTIKAKAPFLTFHLQDIYKNILGIKSSNSRENNSTQIRKILIGTCSTNLFSSSEQENFIYELSMNHPRIPLQDISEVDLLEDVSDTLYIGPATLSALKFCEAGGRGIFLTSHFQGFNLIPYNRDSIILSSRGGTFKNEIIVNFVEHFMNGRIDKSIPYSVYTIDQETIFGSYIKSLNQSDDNYPFYQAYVVLWSYMLSLMDANLIITHCTDSQKELLRVYKEVLEKLLRLHSYAMLSVDTIHQEARAKISDPIKIDGHIKNLKDIEVVFEQIASSHALLRPILDFYRIRRGQNQGFSLEEQSQSSYLRYAEEHQALESLLELFSVTLKKNEVSI